MRKESLIKNEEGIALVTTLMLTLLLSVLVSGMLLASTSDVLISGNEVRTNQAFYIAEAGMNRAAGWFKARFATDAGSDRYLLPEQYDSNTEGEEGKLSYTATPEYSKGARSTRTMSVSATFAPEQDWPTSVKTLAGGALKNVVLAGDGANTYPMNYTVSASATTGVVETRTFDGEVVEDFIANLHNQAEGEGRFSVRATLVSITPPSTSQANGNITWLIESTGMIGGADNTAIATSTISAYLTAPIVAMTRSMNVRTGTERVNADPGVIARGRITWTSNAVDVDSYRSSKGAYNASLAANSYEGQIGSRNRGSRGDLRTNNEPASQGIDIKNGTVTGNIYATLPAPGGEVTFDSLIATGVNNGVGGELSSSDKFYDQNPLIFDDIADPTPPAPGAKPYSYSTKNKTATLPSGNWSDIDVSKGTLIIPPGNYNTIRVDTQGTIVLGQPGVPSIYNLQGFSGGAQGTIIFQGPVTINVSNSLDVGAGSQVASGVSVRPAEIRWNFKGGSGQQVHLGGHSMMMGVFYAPNSDLHMRGGTDFYGVIAARNVDIGGNAAIHVDEDALTGVQTTRAVFASMNSTVGYAASDYKLRRIRQTVN